MDNKNFTTYYKLYVDESGNTYTFTTKKLLYEYLEDRYAIAGRQVSLEGNTFDENRTVNILDKWGNKIRSIGFAYEIKE